MGYEIKLYLGRIHDINAMDEDKEEHYFSVVAWIDLSKPGSNAEILNIDRKLGQRVYLYGIDGNTRISSDPYGDWLFAIPAKRVLDALRDDWARSKKECKTWTGYGYRRFYMAIPLLDRFIETFGPKENPSVVIYGH